jgi:hypothetical protein
MNKVILTLANNIDTYDLVLDVLDTPIAKKWYTEISKNYEFFETHRFTGFPNSPTLKDYSDKINECIDIINNYQTDTIPLRAEEHMSDELTNNLHKYFEVLHGGVLSNSDFLTNAPKSVQWALFQFNVNIHAYEKAHLSLPMITCTFNGPRVPLDDEDYDHFTHILQYGHVYINYCEVGKHLLELYEDHDDICGEENIRPLKYYKADFKLRLGKGISEDEAENYLTAFENWFDSKKEMFDRLGIYKDKYRALGLITVAKMNIEESGLIGLTEEEVAIKICPYNRIHQVRCQQTLD